MTDLICKPVKTPLEKYRFEDRDMKIGSQVLAAYHNGFNEHLQLEMYILRHLVITDIKPLKFESKEIIFNEVEGVNLILVQGNDVEDLTRYKPKKKDKIVGYHTAIFDYRSIRLDSNFDIKALHIRKY